MIKPKTFNCRIIISRIGISPIGTSGLGKVIVNGLSLVPLPPAKIIALFDISDQVNNNFIYYIYHVYIFLGFLWIFKPINSFP